MALTVIAMFDSLNQRDTQRQNVPEPDDTKSPTALELTVVSWDLSSSESTI